MPISVARIMMPEPTEGSCMSIPPSPGMFYRFNPPPNWPPPLGWTPPQGWVPDPSWPPPPYGWQLWIEAPPAVGTGENIGAGVATGRSRGLPRWVVIGGAAVAGLIIGSRDARRFGPCVRSHRLGSCSLAMRAPSQGTYCIHGQNLGTHRCCWIRMPGRVCGKLGCRGHGRISELVCRRLQLRDRLLPGLQQPRRRLWLGRHVGCRVSGMSVRLYQ
jgi:hypothetical protein